MNKWGALVRVVVSAALVTAALGSVGAGTDRSRDVVAVAATRPVAQDAPAGLWDPVTGYFVRDSFIYRAKPDGLACHWMIDCGPERDDPGTSAPLDRALAGWEVDSGTRVDHVYCHDGNYVKIGGPQSFPWTGWAPRSAVDPSNDSAFAIGQCDPWED